MWKAIWLVLALACAVPLAWNAYQRVLEVDRRARVHLIEEHRLWEMHPEYRGKPEVWTRMASHLLNDMQLMTRVKAKYGAAAEQIELDYRRDLAIARAEVIVVAFFWWAFPLGTLYGVALLLRRRSPPTLLRSQPPASVFDPRYMPPPQPAADAREEAQAQRLQQKQ